MNPLVVDASALLEAVVIDGPDPALVERLSNAPFLCAPHLVDVELLHAVRGLVRRGAATDDRGAAALQQFADLPIIRFSHRHLTTRMWTLRHNLSAYDSAYVALAEFLGATLVTCDARLAEAPGVDATVKVYSRVR